MLLAIDAGNTHLVLGCFEGERLLRTWRMATHPVPTADEMRLRIHGLLALDGVEPRAVSDVALSSVVPQVTAALRQAFAERGLRVIDHGWPFSFRIAAQPPHQIGADRLVNAEAAVREHGAPLIVVDSGTATTICAISRDRRYLGGAIMPGIEHSSEILARKTAKLFAVELVPPPSAIGHDTETALRSGILLGYASMIDGMVRRFREELGEPGAPVVATGGVSSLLKGIARELQFLDPDLTLKGIRYLHESLRAR